MKNNEILRRVRESFAFSDERMIEIFALADYAVDRDQLDRWLRREEEPGYAECSDLQLSAFLNGLIIAMRGKREGSKPVPERPLTNNIVCMKLKIALNLQADDLLELLNSVNFSMSRHELSAFFRRPDHKHYRECKDQVLRNFLQGVQLRYGSSQGRS